MTETSGRFALPLLQAGQAQKEIVHNEALTGIDLALHPTAETMGDNAPPGSPVAGRSWIVGASPTGAWSGHAHAIAGWTSGGWRFVAPVTGMLAWNVAAGSWAWFSGAAWSVAGLPLTAVRIGGHQVVGMQQGAIAAPAGGAVVDAEARATLSTVLSALRSHGLIAS